VIVRVVHIGGIFYHRSLNFLFIKKCLKKMFIIYIYSH